jgi:cell division protein FtsW
MAATARRRASVREDAMRLSRVERSLVSDWWFSVDRVLLVALLVLIGAGLLLSLAASPAIAIKHGLPTFHYTERHLAFALLAAAILFTVSLSSAPTVRRLALGVLIAALALMLLVVLTGAEIKGARRWLQLAGYSLQPSEFAKPPFVVLSAWLLTEAERRPDVPASGIAALLYALLAALLIAEPDFGQALLVSLVACALFLLAGRPLIWPLALLAAPPLILLGAYANVAYVRLRLDHFLHPATGDGFQRDHALQSFIEGGLFGKGPGEGTIKAVLPDAHTDFVFAVIAEEYGALACLAVLSLFALIAVRVLSRQRHAATPFARLAAAGLTLLLSLQAIITMAVNVGLLPAKGMTLPFISSGGSSMLATALCAGMLLALTRRRPDPARVERPGIAANLAV